MSRLSSLRADTVLRSEFGPYGTLPRRGAAKGFGTGRPGARPAHQRPFAGVDSWSKQDSCELGPDCRPHLERVAPTTWAIGTRRPAPSNLRSLNTADFRRARRRLPPGARRCGRSRAMCPKRGAQTRHINENGPANGLDAARLPSGRTRLGAAPMGIATSSLIRARRVTASRRFSRGHSLGLTKSL
jgi:hypothetical protein